MKKSYTKPDILFESFSLCTSIAYSCAVKSYTPSSGQCGYVDSGIRVFKDGMLDPAYGCLLPIEDGQEYNGICYHNPTDFNNLFNS